MHESLTIQNARVTDDQGEEQLVTVQLKHGRIAGIVPSGPAEAPSTALLDADGAWLHPGFIDAHVHLVLSGMTLSMLDLVDVTSREMFEQRIAQRHAELKDDEWLLADGWLEPDWGGQLPEQSWLAAAGNRPAVCWKRDHHAMLVNQPVLDLINAAEREDPPGGEIVRGPDGAPTGLLLEAAAWQLVMPCIPVPSAAARQALTLEATRILARHGVVAINSMEYANDVLDVLEPIREQLAVRTMITMLDRVLPIDEPLGRLQAMQSDERLGLIGCKAFLDGTFGSQTAAMLEPWSSDPNGGRGMLVELAERGELNQWIERVVEAELSPSMHAIGDRAARLALDASDHAEAHARKIGAARPWIRIEHCQAVHPADIPRFTDRVASMQPLHVADDGRVARERLGPERMNHFFPFRPLEDAKSILAFGSDWPIAEPDVIRAIAIAVSGRMPDGTDILGRHTIDVSSALNAYTHAARRAIQLPPVNLQPQDPADLVLLDQNPLTANYEDSPPAVVTTIMDGAITYDARMSETDA